MSTIVGPGNGGAFATTLPSNLRIFAGGFAGGYVGITWMKNVFVLTRDYWNLSLGTPYSGQLFPHGGNAPGPGQVFPY